MLARFTAFSVWLLLGGSVAYWGLQLLARPLPMPATALPAGEARATQVDLGRLLGCGAHVAKLHRVQAGPFREADAISLAALEALKNAESVDALDRLLQPANTALQDLPLLLLTESACFYLRRGQAVAISEAPAAGSLVQLQATSGELLGVGEILEDGRVAPRRLVNQQPQIHTDQATVD